MTAVTVSESPRSARFALADSRLPAIAGLIFVAGLVFQNILHAAIDPAGDATGGAILSNLASHRGVLEFAYGLFAVELVMVFLFAGYVYARAVSTSGGWLARAGLLGVAGIVTLFSANVAIEVALSASTTSLASSPHVVEALWAIHQAFFGLNFAAIGTGLLGLSLASVSAGIAPRLFRVAGPVGAGLLIVGALFALRTAEGAMPGMAIALPGFITWSVWVLAVSIHLLREPATPAA